MYCHSVNLSIAHYSRRNSIADAHVKPVFVITSAWIESCFQMKLILYYLFTSLLSSISFAFYHINWMLIFYYHSRVSLKHFLSFFILIYSEYILIIFMLHCHEFKKIRITNSIWHTFVAMQIVTRVEYK